MLKLEEKGEGRRKEEAQWSVGGLSSGSGNHDPAMLESHYHLGCFGGITEAVSRMNC